MDKNQANNLPVELRELVKKATTVLGELVRQDCGQKAFDLIESMRKGMADLREAQSSQKKEKLGQYLIEIKKSSLKEQFLITHAFALMLELMNSCENAYRTFRLNTSFQSRSLSSLRNSHRIITFVLTAHPTEARSPQNISIFFKIQEILVNALESGFELVTPKLEHFLKIAWKLPLTRMRKPTVKDEAEHIYSIVLRREILNFIFDSSMKPFEIRIRSWVGGDKDGHPGVNEKTLIQSLSLSRKALINFLNWKLKEVQKTVTMFKTSELHEKIKRIYLLLKDLRNLKKNDIEKILMIHKEFEKFKSSYSKEIGVIHPDIILINQLLASFPALVIPLELRESSDIILKTSSSHPTAIYRMLQKIKYLSAGKYPRWYASGLIISMANHMDHILAAGRIQTEVFGSLKLPIIPLFEQRQALQDSVKIVHQMITKPLIQKAIKTHWNSELEVMVGYSDSAKEVGVFPSRLAIAESIHQIDLLCNEHQITPIFFHGSGGSIDRGGGSIEEQTSWWPCSALQNVKMTIQGEMVERSFSSPAILLRQLLQINVCQTSQKGLFELNKDIETLRAFSAKVQKEYHRKVSSQSFFDIIESATPYPYLNVLKFGSRPAKRGKFLSVSNLRAIPWVLCWTQTRVLFPTWWGIGEAWKTTTPEEQKRLKNAFETNALFRTFVKALGFTLSKVDLDIWEIYLRNSELPNEQIQNTLTEFHQEMHGAISFVKELSGHPHLLWFRPWLETSIKLRSPMIHPLNLIEISAIQKKDFSIFRESVAGIAIGMLTTG